MSVSHRHRDALVTNAMTLIRLANALSYIPHFPLFKKWFHVQFIACNALHFCTIIAGIPTVGKPAIITQKLQ